jgi:hypothetical protein
MQAGGYFVTSESEKAAKWDILEQYQDKKSHMATLENQMQKLAEALSKLSFYLRNPHGMEIPYVETDEEIVGRNMLSKVETFRLTKEQFNWENLVALVKDYQGTQREKERLHKQLKAMKIDVND